VLITQARKDAAEALHKSQALELPSNFVPYHKGDLVWLEGKNLCTTHPSCKASAKKIWTLPGNRHYIQNLIPNQAAPFLESAQCVPWHTPYALQGNHLKWQQISRTRPRPSGQTTQMGSGTNFGRQEETPPTPILVQVERVLRST
jgi:hypothetical protein